MIARDALVSHLRTWAQQHESSDPVKITAHVAHEPDVSTGKLYVYLEDTVELQESPDDALWDERTDNDTMSAIYGGPVVLIVGDGSDVDDFAPVRTTIVFEPFSISNQPSRFSRISNHRAD